MSYRFCFHRVIVAYLLFILASLAVAGCGYKADPFYKEQSAQSGESSADSKPKKVESLDDEEAQPKKKVLFQSIDTHAVQGDEEDE